MNLVMNSVIFHWKRCWSLPGSIFFNTIIDCGYNLYFSYYVLQLFVHTYSVSLEKFIDSFLIASILRPDESMRAWKNVFNSLRKFWHLPLLISVLHEFSIHSQLLYLHIGILCQDKIVTILLFGIKEDRRYEEWRETKTKNFEKTNTRLEVCEKNCKKTNNGDHERGNREDRGRILRRGKRKRWNDLDETKKRWEWAIPGVKYSEDIQMPGGNVFHLIEDDGKW